MVYWKKSQLDMSNIVKILLFLAVAFVIMLFFTGFIDISKKSADDGTCRITVVMNNNIKTLTFGKDTISLKCPRKTIIIDDDKVQYKQADNKWKDTKTFSAKLSSDKNQFYKVAADEMGDCWYKMGEGKLNVFNKDFAAIGGDTYYRTTCLICGEITFDRSQISLGTSGEFFDYLQTHNYTRNGINKKYYDYMLMEYPAQLSPKLLELYFKADNSIYIHGFENNQQLSTSDQYIIFFKALKFSHVAGETGETYTKLFGEKTFFRADDNYYIFFARPEIVPTVCGIIIN